MIKVISEVIDVTLDDQGEAWDTKICQAHGHMMLKFFSTKRLFEKLDQFRQRK